jgi:type IV pilus assembly protein PilW
MNRLYRQYGLTMIELMVTLVITGIITAGVINLYVGSISQSKQTSNLAAMQESGRFALELLARDIRMAGFSGCTAYDELEDSNNTADEPEKFWGLYSRGGEAFVDQALHGVQGWEASGTALGQTVDLVTEETSRTGTRGGNWTGDGTISEDYPEAIANSDIIRVWAARDAGVDIIDLVSTEDSITLTARDGHRFAEGDLILFASCDSRVLGQICSVSGDQLQINSGSSGTCNNEFRPGFVFLGTGIGDDEEPEGEGGAADEIALKGEAFSYSDVTYFVGKRDDGANTPPALFRAVGDVAREMVEGVENLQILYGVDLDRTDAKELRRADVYMTAAEVGDNWSNVVSVRISVLMRSFERGLVSGTQRFNFNNVEHTADDGYLRQVYSTTIALRNRTVGRIEGLFSASNGG